MSIGIKSANPLAESETEILALQLAVRLNFPPRKYRRERNPKGKYIGEIHAAAEKESSQEKELRSWQDLILEEIHATVCKRTRHKKEFSVVKRSADGLIIAIAAGVAKTLGVDIVVVAPLVAALLRIMFAMGISVFCKRFDTGTL